MFGFNEDDHKQVYQNGDQKTSFGQEVLAGAASFEAARLFESHQRSEGKSVSHGFAKELLAGFVGGEVDKYAQKEYISHEDKQQLTQQATQQAQGAYDQHYGQYDQWDPNHPPAVQNY